MKQRVNNVKGSEYFPYPLYVGISENINSLVWTFLMARSHFLLICSKNSLKNLAQRVLNVAQIPELS